ncbi:hypothetical protein M092_3410 [Parabacteroides distasonis str. 3776 D15 iv]|nr:hypothetical protein M092_3410 [Parabacteroides distasonis str. 3776 D15 iv]KDS76028.1 hypothetical protein M096_1717 [Parabacteroides distasonis str. 3999B T(B) 6]
MFPSFTDGGIWFLALIATKGAEKITDPIIRALRSSGFSF